MERKIKIFSFAAILMLAVVVIGCKHNVNNKPEAFTVTFSVDGTPPNGTLKATVDGSEINSGNKVEHGKTVTFTATPDAGYTVKEWKADGSAVTGSTSNTYTCTVTKALTVKVSFLAGGASYTVKHYQEKIEGGYPAEPAESENQNGTVGANAAYTAKNYTGFTYKPTLTKVNNTVQTEGTINADSSTVVELYYERNTVNVTFKLAGGNVSGNTADILKTGKYGTALTAPAPEREGYAFKGWSPAPPSPLAFPAINTEYTAQWKINKYPVIFNVDGAEGTLKATVDGSEINPGNTVEHGKTVTFTATPNDNYEVDKWTITGSAFETGTGIGGSTTAKVKITATVNITVSFKLNKYPVTFSVDGTGGTLKAKADGVAETETSPITVEHGKTVAFTAAPAAGYRVKGWTLDGTAIAKAGTNTEYTLTVTKPAAVTVSFEPKKALLTLEAGKNTVKVKAKTADGSAIKVEGCNETELANEAETTLTVTNPERKLALIGDIIELDCRGEETTGGNRPLIALDVSGCTALQKLNCQYNQIPELDVQGLTALQELNCQNNQLPALDVQDLATLQKLDCQDNKLSTLNVSGCTALKELICINNQISELNVQNLTALQKLDCSDNQLTTLNVQGLTALKELNCDENQLSTLNVQGCSSLKRLTCYKNKLDADAFTKLFNDLPKWEESDGAKAVLYVDRAGITEDNCKDFNTPTELKTAFENAKNIKHWKMKKTDGYIEEDI